jgi:hypothetical protein
MPLQQKISPVWRKYAAKALCSQCTCAKLYINNNELLIINLIAVPDGRMQKTVR